MKYSNGTLMMARARFAVHTQLVDGRQEMQPQMTDQKFYGRIRCPCLYIAFTHSSVKDS